MQILDIKVGIPSGNGKSFWHTIGTVFVSDDSVVKGTGDKPATFVMPFPKVNGIIVSRKPKDEVSE